MKSQIWGLNKQASGIVIACTCPQILLLAVGGFTRGKIVSIISSDKTPHIYLMLFNKDIGII